MNSRITSKIGRILLLFMLLAVALPVLAQDDVTDDEVNEVAKDLFCPVCESTPLDVCPTQACADWRELIRTQLAAGQSKEEIHEYFARQYGDGVLADPPKRGFNLILWVLPVVALLIGGIIFARYLKSLRAAGQSGESAPVQSVSPAAAPNDSPSEKSPEDEINYTSKVEEELHNL